MSSLPQVSSMMKEGKKLPKSLFNSLFGTKRMEISDNELVVVDSVKKDVIEVKMDDGVKEDVIEEKMDDGAVTMNSDSPTSNQTPKPPAKLKTISIQVIKAIATTELQTHLKTKSEETTTQLQRLQSKLLPTSHTCTFIWKLNDFASHKEQIKFGRKREVFSDNFVTHPFGYRMCFVLKPRINDLVQRIYLGFSIRVLQGPVDEILKWPMTYHAKVTLFDQLNGQKHHSCDWVKGAAKTGRCGVVSEFAMKRYTKDAVKKCFITVDKLLPLYIVDDSLLFKVEIKVL